MNFGLSCTALEDVPEGMLVCGFVGTDGDDKEVKELTEHYFTGEYVVQYYNKRMIGQGVIHETKKMSAQQVMNMTIKKDIKHALVNGLTLTAIYYREEVEDDI